MANQKAIEKKQSEVSALAEKMKESKLVLLTDYRGISVEDVTGLRSNLRKVDAEYKVMKNNIARRGWVQQQIEGLEDLLVGPTAVVLASEDYLEPLKAVYEYAKNNETYKIKGGVIDGKVMTTEELITLAKLPSRETLISMLAGALLGNISKLAVALDQVRVQKETNE